MLNTYSTDLVEATTNLDILVSGLCSDINASNVCHFENHTNATTMEWNITIDYSKLDAKALTKVTEACNNAGGRFCNLTFDITSIDPYYSDDSFA